MAASAPIQIDLVGLCGVAIVDFSDYASLKGHYLTVSLVILVYVCPLLDNVTFKDDVEWQARLVTHIAITWGNIIRLHLNRNNLVGLVYWLKGDP